MAVVERHKSSNQLPDLIVERDGDDWMTGFDGHAWHTHGDILHAWGYRGSPAEATRQFVADILASRRPIIVWCIDGKIDALDVPVERDVDLALLEENARKYGPPGQAIEIRYWGTRPRSL